MTGPRTDDADEEFDTAQYVTFEMDGARYAFPMHRVREIIRVPDLVRVPLGPPALVGIANLRGRVLPVVNLRRCCGLPVAADDETTRVIVVDALAPVGLVVDRVTSVVSVDPAMVESGAAVQGTLHSDVLAAVVKTPAGMVTALDVDRILGSQFRMLDADQAIAEGYGAPVTSAIARAIAGATADAMTGGMAGAEAGDPAESGDEPDGTGAVELVSFTVDGQEYALPIDRVREIVQVPEAVSPVPNSSDRVMGVMDLRGKLVPVLSMRRVFGLPMTPLRPQHRIVVVALTGGRVVGVVTDEVREVLRVPADLVTELPEAMAATGRASEVESVCRLDEGARLVSVLSLERFVADPRWAGDPDAYEGSGTAPEQPEEASHDVDDGDRRDEELLVVFRLDGEQYAVDVDRVQEIIRVPETLIQVPNTEHYVEGLVNLRGTVLPVVDLRTRLGLPRLDRDERQRIVVLTRDNVRTGFIVDSVVEVARVPRQVLGPAPNLSAAQVAVVAQVANLTTQDRMLLVVDADGLLGGSGAARSGATRSGGDRPALAAAA